MENVIIIGAGLSGLSAAYYLKKRGVDALVIEARERYGGRILTAHASGNNTAVEMGATWFTDKHTSYIRLLKELQLPFFRQYQKGVAIYELQPDPPQLFDMADGGESSYRVVGGTSTVIKALVDYIGKNRVFLNSPIREVVEQKEHIDVRTMQGKTLTCKNLIITLPPYLIAAQKISFIPELPVALSSLMENTHTWMGDAIKFALEYRNPFWREKGYAGTMLSPAGIASEVYDHCNYEETHFALKGFLSVDAAGLPEEERKVLVVEQLTKLLGTEAGDYLSYTEKMWANDEYTYANYPRPILPHQHNGHPLYSQTLMSGRLYLAGTETSSRFGGYMEGAVYSGLTAARNILNKKGF
jgi:monoamine oxidase